MPFSSFHSQFQKFVEIEEDSYHSFDRSFLYSQKNVHSQRRKDVGEAKEAYQPGSKVCLSAI